MALYILEFSKESDQAVQEVLRSASELYGNFTVLSKTGNAVKVQGDFEHIREMAFLNYATRVLLDFESIGGKPEVELPEGSFHVRKKDYTGKDTLSEAEIGESIRGGRAISFRNPDFVVRAVKTDRWYLGLQEFQKDSNGINRRRAPLRPFFSPVTIHPKFARFLVNLSRTRPGDLILDPFCGTGGILLEAHLMGRKVAGSDASLTMVKGARLNLKYYNVGARIDHMDFSDIKTEVGIKAIVTDLPYGKNSELSNYNLEDMYTKIFPKFHSLLDEGGHAALVLSDTSLLKNSEGYFEILSSTAFRQHRSLTRHFVALRRI